RFHSGDGIGDLRGVDIDRGPRLELVADSLAPLHQSLEDEQVAVRLHELPVRPLRVAGDADEIALERLYGVALGVAGDADLGELHVRAGVAEQGLVVLERVLELARRIGAKGRARARLVGVAQLLLDGEPPPAAELTPKAGLRGDILR